MMATYRLPDGVEVTSLDINGSPSADKAWATHPMLGSILIDRDKLTEIPSEPEDGFVGRFGADIWQRDDQPEVAGAYGTVLYNITIERMTSDISADLRKLAYYGNPDDPSPLLVEAADKLDGLITSLAECIGQRDDALRIVEAFMGQHTYDESSVLNPVTGKPYGPGPLWAGAEPMDYPDPRCVCGELWGHDRCSHVEEALQSAAGALPAGLLNAKVRFWLCPRHRQGRVHWSSESFASCLEWGCDQTSEPANDQASDPRKLPVCPGCRHCHHQGEKCADHSWGDSCPYDAGADCKRAEDTGMPEPCQPIGCDNGHHLAGCMFIEVDAAPAPATDAGSREADRA